MNMFQEAEGVTSMRRVLAAFFAVAAIPLAIIPLGKGAANWYSFLPCGISISAVLLLMFFTTWSDIAGAVEKLKGK